MFSLEQLLRIRLDNLKPANGGRGWQAACPVCRSEGGDSTRSHLRIYPHGAYVCAKHKGDPAHNKAIYAFVYQGADASVLASMEADYIDPEPTKLDADKVYPEEMLSRLVPDHRYWLGRGISEEVLRKLEGGLAPIDEKSKLSGRYLFPIRDHVTTRIVGWSGRLVGSNSFGPKWKHLVRVSRCVYPLTAARESILSTHKVVLYESMGDYLSAATCGIPNGLVLMGLHLNSRALGFLVSAGLNEVIISTNNDTLGKATSKEAGNKAAETLRAKLIPYLGEHRVRIRLPTLTKDWNDGLVAGNGELATFRDELEGRGLVAPDDAAVEADSIEFNLLSL